MSCNYADGLSEYEDKGILGTPEKFDSEKVLDDKCTVLYNMLVNAKHVVVHTGAGISTSAGIPDFRGPNGVWTLQEKGLKPNINVSFTDAKPTITHMAINKLVQMGIVKYVVSQNIDGLHLKSGLERRHLAELHGNMFIEKCNACQRQFVRGAPVETVGQKSLGGRCRALRGIGTATCRGFLYDLVLDWEHSLPDDDLTLADLHSSVADLSICFGTTLQIIPSGNLPTYTLKNGGKLVIVNLQPTKHDKKASLVINSYVDETLKRLMKKLEFEIPEYCFDSDPTKTDIGREWFIPKVIISDLKLKYKECLKNRNLKKQKRSSTAQKKKEEKVRKINTVSDVVAVTDSREIGKTHDDVKPDIEVKKEEDINEHVDCDTPVIDSTLQQFHDTIISNETIKCIS